MFVSCSEVVSGITIHDQTCYHTQILVLGAGMLDFCSEFDLWISRFATPIRALFVFDSCSGVVSTMSIHDQTCSHTQIWILVAGMHVFLLRIWLVDILFCTCKFWAKIVHPDNQNPDLSMGTCLMMNTYPKNNSRTRNKHKQSDGRMVNLDVLKSNSDQKSWFSASKIQIWDWKHVVSWLVILETTSEQESNTNRARMDEWENWIFTSQILSKTLI